MHTEPRPIVTPVTATDRHASSPTRARSSCPILRAGLGMLDGMTRLLPTAEVGFLGMQRDEETLEAITYANRLPDDLSGPPVLPARPDARDRRHARRRDRLPASRAARATSPRSACSPPPRVCRCVEQAVGDRVDVKVVVAAVDERLNEKAYIVPGLGDAGDRLYGVV